MRPTYRSIRANIQKALGLVLLLCFFSISSKAQTVNASVFPDPYIGEVNDVFTIQVDVDPNGGMITVGQVAMNYDPSIAIINSVSFAPGSPLGIPLPGTTIDNVEGFFFIAGFGFTPVTSPFTHVEIEFTAVGAGTIDLEFVKGDLLQTLFSDNGTDISGTLTDGQIIITSLFDCPNLGLNIGDSCDDGDSETENDEVLSDCTCAGIPICQNPFPVVDESSLTTVIGASTVEFGWDPVPGQIGCQVQVARALGTPFQSQSFTLFDDEADSFSLNLNLIIPGILHGWRVRCGCSASPIIAGPFTSYQTFTLPSQITISSQPNPTSGQSQVQFSIGEESDVMLEVFDLSGRMINRIYAGFATSSNEHRFDFDGSNLPNGVYVYRLTTENEVINEKFMIAK
ncbi:MAG: T9SS type A sorting domain-containing protein [Bacteroidota bacterium]